MIAVLIIQIWILYFTVLSLYFIERYCRKYERNKDLYKSIPRRFFKRKITIKSYNSSLNGSFIEEMKFICTWNCIQCWNHICVPQCEQKSIFWQILPNIKRTHTRATVAHRKTRINRTLSTQTQSWAEYTIDDSLNVWCVWDKHSQSSSCIEHHIYYQRRYDSHQYSIHTHSGAYMQIWVRVRVREYTLAFIP